MKKSIFLYIIFFASGFLTHAFFFPDILANGITDVKSVAIPNTAPAEEQSQDPLTTKVTFDGKQFSRHNVTIGFTRYLQIVNANETQMMSLFSNVPELTTPRPYGHMEAVQTQFNQKGQFVVVDRNNPEEKLIITVK